MSLPSGLQWRQLWYVGPLLWVMDIAIWQQGASYVVQNALTV